MKKYTVYKITNKINNKIYIGTHVTNNLNDDYMGSGKMLKFAQDKYGIENFKKEYLHIFDSSDEMFEMESILVNEDFVKRNDTYNLNIGGYGGFRYLNENGLNNKNNQCYILSDKIKDDPLYLDWFVNQVKKGIKESDYIPGTYWKGKKHTEESKKKIGSANSINQKGKKNSQYGTCWVYNSKINENKKVKKTEVEYWLDKGWVRGRKIKF